MQIPTRRLAHDRSYLIGVIIFFLIMAAALLGLYYATLKIDYVWRWNRIPQYFYFQDDIETKAEILGEVESIKRKGEQTVIVVKGDDDTESYTVSTDNIHVDEGDFIYPGDVLASYKEWKFGILMQGLWLTIKVSVIGIIFGILIGLIAGMARVSSNPALKWTSIVYVEIIRGSPLLVQIMIWYFVLGTLFNILLMQYGLSEIPPIWYGVASLACFSGAYVAEIVRSGIQSIHRGQTEASRSLGMTYAQSMTHVILPQAIRIILPPLAGQFITLIKDSSLLGIIAIRELVKATREVVTTSLQPFELWFVCAILYLVLTFTLSMFVQYLERRGGTSG